MITKQVNEKIGMEHIKRTATLPDPTSPKLNTLLAAEGAATEGAATTTPVPTGTESSLDAHSSTVQSIVEPTYACCNICEIKTIVPVFRSNSALAAMSQVASTNVDSTIDCTVEESASRHLSSASHFISKAWCFHQCTSWQSQIQWWLKKTLRVTDNIAREYAYNLGADGYTCKADLSTICPDDLKAKYKFKPGDATKACDAADCASNHDCEKCTHSAACGAATPHFDHSDAAAAATSNSILSSDGVAVSDETGWPAHGPGGESDIKAAAATLKDEASAQAVLQLPEEEEILDLAGIDMLGTGYDAKQPCEFETCSKRKIVRFTYDLARRVRVMGKIYSMPDQVAYEPIYHTGITTHAWGSSTSVANSFAQFGGGSDAASTADGFSGSVSARFSMSDVQESEHYQTYYGMRSIDVALYRLSLKFEANDEREEDGCGTEEEWTAKGFATCANSSLYTTGTNVVNTAKATLCGRSYCQCTRNFLHDYCVALSGLVVQDNVEDDPRAFLQFTNDWGTSFVKSTRIGAALEINMLVQQARNVSDVNPFETAKRTMEGEFSAGFSTASAVPAKQNDDIHISLVANERWRSEDWRRHG
jgi:hypothetical protein